MRIQKVSQAWYGMVMSGGLVLLLAILMLCPIVPDGASAAMDPACAQEPGSELCCAVSPDDVSCAGSGSTAEPSISLALAARTEINIVPVPKGEFNASTASLKVAVNNATSQEVEGYKIYLKTETSNNSLTGATLTDRSIQSITANTTKASFPNNTWGYSLNRVGTATADTATYSPVPTTSTIIDDSTLLAGDYDLIFATKVDTATAPDQYSTALVVSAIAEPKEIVGLLTIDNMQDMTSAVCSESKEGDTKQLVDARDGKKYWVTKLKDGNCWMTQNLALDITAAGLKVSDTDIARDWTSTQSADPSVTTVHAPTNTLNVGQAGSSSDTSTSSWRGNNITNNHDSSGNYYTFRAATAGTGVGTSMHNAPGSICPKQWRLPVSGEQTNAAGGYIPNADNEFYKLLHAYGYPVNTSYTADVSGGYTPIVQDGATNLAGSPMYFAYSGYMSQSGDIFGTTGTMRYWSSYGSTSTLGNLYVSTSKVYPNHDVVGAFRLSGFSVRCLAR